MCGWASHLTVFPWPMQKFRVWSETNLSCGGTCPQFPLCNVQQDGLQHNSGSNFHKSKFLWFYSMFGDAFYSPFPRDLLGSPRFLCLLYVQACSTWWSSNTLNWLVKRWPVGLLGAVLSFGSSCGFFLAQVTLGGNSSIMLLSANINAMLRARFETQKIQDVS